ncbi:hypothetical protein BH23BAC1_BH23BAC1_25870 [soil metagenome]
MIVEKYCAPSIVNIISLLTVILFLLSCQDSKDNKASDFRGFVNEMTINPDTLNLDNKRSGTRKMIQILREHQEKEKPEINIYLNSQRADLYYKLSEDAKEEKEKWKYRFLYARESLYAGKTWEAIEILQEIIRNQNPLLDYVEKDIREIFDFLGIAYLRLGEQENCLRFHNHQSCIIPIAPSAQHQWELGSEKAMEIYALMLKNNPGDFHSRWLYNIAGMTLGKYPHAIPKEWLIPLPSTGKVDNFKAFKDIAGDLGIDSNGLSGGVCMEDFSGNGFLDIVTSSFGSRDQIFYYENQGDGTFLNKTFAAGLEGITGGLNMIHGDYNNDGYPDIFVLRGGWWGSEGELPNSLLKNNGDGTFEDITESAGLLSFYPTQTASWVDIDNDGWLDLFIGNESKGELLNLPAVPGRKEYPSELYLNNRDGTFRNVAKEAGLELMAFVKGNSWGDVNNDGYPDAYISVLGGKNKLFINQTGTSGKLKFQEITDSAGVGEPFHSFPVWFWDYDQDGWLDIFVSGYGTEETVPYSIAAAFLGAPTGASFPKLYRNNGDLTFTDVSKEAGLQVPLFSMGSNFGDINNDGFPDFYVGTGVPELFALIPSQMFLNKGGEEFEDITFSGGFGHLQKGHAIAFGDIDNDGDLDVYCVMGGAFEGDIYRNVLYENPGNENNWITLKLKGSTSNYSAIGARISIITESHKGEIRTLYKKVTTGGSFGASPLQQLIGLGENIKTVQKIEIQWPDKLGSKTVYHNLPVNTFWEIHQNNILPVQLHPGKVKFMAKDMVKH